MARLTGPDILAYNIDATVVDASRRTTRRTDAAPGVRRDSIDHDRRSVVATVIRSEIPSPCSWTCWQQMTTTPEHDEQMANLTFASVYPHYVTKVEKKGRTIDELHEVINWLTGFNAADIQSFVSCNATFSQFFDKATINPNAHLITGTICGYRIEDISTPLTKKIRYLDKLVDELAKGRKMEKILRA